MSKFFKQVRETIARGIANQIYLWFLPVLSTVSVVITGMLDDIPDTYLLTSAIIAFGLSALGINQISIWNRRLKPSQEIIAGDPTHLWIETNARHQSKQAIQIHVPILSLANDELFYKVTKATVYLHKSDGTEKRENLPYRGKRTDIIPARGQRRPQIPAIIVEDLLNEKIIEGRLEFELKFGRRKRNHKIVVSRRINFVKQPNEEWLFQATTN